MDLESETSALEDNGLIGEVGTIEDELVSVSASNVEADKDEKTIIDLDKPVETSPPISKGFGLRKWRRRRRDVVKDDTSVNMENTKILKRVLSESANPQAKQMHFPGQDSIGSVNNNKMVGFAIAGSSLDGTGLAFSAGMDSDNSEDASSKSSTAASGPKVRYERTMGHHSWDKERAKYLGGKSVIRSGDSSHQQGKSRVDKSKKARGGERIKIEKENSHSSMESADSRSSNFVFMQGASYSFSSSREPGGRRMMDYNEENSDQDAHTSNRKDNSGEEEEDYSQGDSLEESEFKNNGSSDNLDQLTEAFNSFHTLQESLQKELQKFQVLGKEPISSLHDGGESSGCIHTSEASSSRRFGSENMASVDSEILSLVNNVEHLETKLEETKSILEAKETHIRELKSNINVSEGRSNGGTEIGVEEIFQQKMEAEIEYIIFSRSVDGLSRKIKLVEEEKTLAEDEAHKTLSRLGEAETKAENLKNQTQDLQNHCVEITETQSLKKRVFKTTSCLLLQLGLLVILFNFQLNPESENVVPT